MIIHCSTGDQLVACTSTSNYGQFSSF